jgi:hypothetical protein
MARVEQEYKNKFMVSEYRALKRIYEPEIELTRGWGKWNNGKLHNMNCTQNIIRTVIQWGVEMGREYITHGRDNKLI